MHSGIGVVQCSLEALLHVGNCKTIYQKELPWDRCYLNYYAKSLVDIRINTALE